MRMTPLFLLSTLFSGCIEPVQKPLSQAAQSEVTPQILEDVGSLVILPTLERFVSTADGLRTRLEALESAPTDDDLILDAQAQWIASAAIWQQLELMQIGPAGSSLSVLGGQDIRDEIYSWPTVNPCLVDQKTAEGLWSSDSYFTDNTVNAYGLDALEHLLFAELDTVCPSQVPPVSDGAWQALGPVGVSQQRVAFAKFLLNGLTAQVTTLQSAWSEDGDNFGVLMQGEQENSPYASRDDALYAIYYSLFYLETMTKDRKLAVPLGLKDCSTDCSDQVESHLSQSSTNAIQSNLIGFKTLFSGADGMGFDDLLSDLGHADLAEDILADTDAAIAFAEQFEQPLSDAIVNQPEQVMEFYDHIGVITDQLKGDLATVLMMDVPAEAAGDND